MQIQSLITILIAFFLIVIKADSEVEEMVKLFMDSSAGHENKEELDRHMETVQKWESEHPEKHAKFLELLMEEFQKHMGDMGTLDPQENDTEFEREL